MPERGAADLLISCIKDRNLGFDIDASELLRAAGSGDEDLEAWVRENLGHDTLLTKEELALYNSLESSGEAQALEASQNLNCVRGFEDGDFHNAIEELQRSTATIEKQSQILKVQRDAVETLVATNTQQRQSRLAANDAQQRAWLAEYDQASNTVEELVNGLSEYVKEIKSQLSTADSTLVHQSSDIVRSDDKILASLQKLSGALDHDLCADDNASDSVRQLCASLIKYTVESDRVRLNRVYLESLDGAHPKPNYTSDQHDEIFAQQEELESLYSEILPVAQMSAEQRYLQCALKTIAAQDEKGQDRSRKIVDYISGCVSLLINRLDVFSGQAEGYQGHTAILNIVIRHLRAEIDAVDLSPPTTKPQALDSSPAKRRDPRLMTPARPRAAAHKRVASLSFDEEMAPEQQLLRLLGVSLPEDPCSDEAVTRSLQDTLADRAEKLKAYERTLQSSTETAITGHLQNSFATVQLLRDSMLSETKAREIQLADEEVQTAISGLELELNQLQNDLHSVDLDKLRERNAKRDSIIERWGH